MANIGILIIVVACMGGFFILVGALSYLYSLRGIKNKTAGNGQHGTARWASEREIRKVYRHIPFTPQEWRSEPNTRPAEQGIVVGCESRKGKTVALVDTGDVHCMMIGAAGVGKTAYWLYPNIEYVTINKEIISTVCFREIEYFSLSFASDHLSVFADLRVVS